jgi:hypothetical protein
MPTTATSTTIPSNGSTATIVTPVPATSANAFEATPASVAVRNTGTVTVLIGGLDGNLVFPLQPNEFLGVSVDTTEGLYAKVQTNGTAGQVATLAL